jgi:threonine dehydratase/serine racemase
MNSRFAATIDDIRAAAETIRPYAQRTPVITSQQLNQLAGKQLFFKCENLQKVGAFKFRGACNAVFNLSETLAARGVITHSSGNHAQALALAAALRGISATVIMPENASPVKRAAVIGYGAQVVDCAPTLEARETTMQQIQSQTGATFIPPYDHPLIIAGQGTAALELLDEVPDLDAVIAPVGGGGLLAGTAIACHSIRPQLKIFAAEPSGADDAARSKAVNQLIAVGKTNTIADGLLTSLGELTWPIIRDLVADVIVVDDAQTIRAMEYFWSRTKLIIEPSAAVAVAAVLSQQLAAQTDIQRMGIIISGGNLSLQRLPWQTALSD